MVGEYLQNTKQLKWSQLTLSVVAHLMSDGKAIYISYQFIKSEEKMMQVLISIIRDEARGISRL